MKPKRLRKYRYLLWAMLLGMLMLIGTACGSPDQQTGQDKALPTPIEQTQVWPMTYTSSSIHAWLADDPARQIIILRDAVSLRATPGFEFRLFSHPNVRILPSGDTFVIPATPVCYISRGNRLPEIASAIPDAIIANHDVYVPGYTTWCLESPLYISGIRASWQNGMALLESEIDGDFAPGNQLWITYRWLYTARDSSMETYRIFNHLLLDGENITQPTGYSVPVWTWHEDDMLITRFTLNLPAELQEGEYELVTGFNTYPGMERISLESGDSQRKVDSWILGPKEPQKIIDPTLDVY